MLYKPSTSEVKKKCRQQILFWKHYFDDFMILGRPKKKKLEVLPCLYIIYLQLKKKICVSIYVSLQGIIIYVSLHIFAVFKG